MAATSKLHSCNRMASCRRTTFGSCTGVTFQMTHQTFADCWHAFLQARCLSWNPTKNGERTADTHTQTSAMQDKCFNAGVKFLQLTVEGFQLQCALLKPLTTAITANSIFIFISYKICRIKSPVNPATEQRSSLIVWNQHNHWQTRLSSNIVTHHQLISDNGFQQKSEHLDGSLYQNDLSYTQRHDHSLHLSIRNFCTVLVYRKNLNFNFQDFVNCTFRNQQRLDLLLR